MKAITWTLLPGLLNSLIFVTLSVLHFYWSLGGKAAIEKTLPTNREGKRMLNPGKVDSASIKPGMDWKKILLFPPIKSLKLPFQSLPDQLVSASR